MKNHDFGQFIFNDSILDKSQVYDVIQAAKHSKPSLAIAALFLQLIEPNNLSVFDDDSVIKLLNQNQIDKTKDFMNGQSILFAKSMLDLKLIDFHKLFQLIDEYNNLKISPIETALTNYYDRLKIYPDIDFPFAVEIFQRFHKFLSETFKSSIVIIPRSKSKGKSKFGASVKIAGKVPAVVSILADEKNFLNVAKQYEPYVEILEDAHDAISELLNVFTGQFVVQIAVTKGIEEEPEPPRVGTVSGDVYDIAMMSDVGIFHIYIGKQEIFEENA